MEDLASNDVDFDQGEQISGWTEIAAHRNLANIVCPIKLK